MILRGVMWLVSDYVVIYGVKGVISKSVCDVIN